jgi:hypothetical protein
MVVVLLAVLVLVVDAKSPKADISESSAGVEVVLGALVTERASASVGDAVGALVAVVAASAIVTVEVGASVTASSSAGDVAGEAAGAGVSVVGEAPKMLPSDIVVAELVSLLVADVCVADDD